MSMDETGRLTCPECDASHDEWSNACAHDGAPGPEGSPCDSCPGCIIYCRLADVPPIEADTVFRLLDAMVREISLLEAEVVRTRQALAEYLPERWADGLRDDILRGLSAPFGGDYEAYDRFVNERRNGGDPLDSREHADLLLRLAEGTDETTYFHLLPGNNSPRA